MNMNFRIHYIYSDCVALRQMDEKVYSIREYVASPFTDIVAAAGSFQQLIYSAIRVIQ